MSRFFLLAIVLCLLPGCEQSNTLAGTGDNGMLSYLSSMDSVRISLRVYSRHRREERQTSFDPGTNLTIEGERSYWFTNFDTSSMLNWSDSGFSAKAKFGFRQFIPFTNEYHFWNASNSIMAGYYDEATKTLRDVRCVLKYFQPLGALNFQSANASLAISELRQSAVNEDSVEFVATGFELKDVVTIGFVAEEIFNDGDYRKITRLDSVLWEEPTFEPVVRVVFFPKD